MTATIRRDSPRYELWTQAFGTEPVQIFEDRDHAGHVKVCVDQFTPARQFAIGKMLAGRARRVAYLYLEDAKARGWFAVNDGDDLVIVQGYGNLLEEAS